MKLIKSVDPIKRVDTSHRKFRQFNLNYIDNPELLLKSTEELFDDITNALVKVNITCREDQIADIKIRKITEYIKAKSFYLKPIIPKIIRENTVYKDVKLHLNPLDAIREFLSTEKLELRDSILLEAEKIIEEVNSEK